MDDKAKFEWEERGFYVLASKTERERGPLGSDGSDRKGKLHSKWLATGALELLPLVLLALLLRLSQRASGTTSHLSSPVVVAAAHHNHATTTSYPPGNYPPAHALIRARAHHHSSENQVRSSSSQLYGEATKVPVDHTTPHPSIPCPRCWLAEQVDWLSVDALDRQSRS